MEVTTFNLKKTLADMQGLGYMPVPNKVRWQIPNAKQLLEQCLHTYMGEKATWLPIYDEVADWLANNEGRGLFCYGDKGLGKTMLCYRCIPPIIYAVCNRVMFCYENAQEMNDKLDEVLTKKLVYIDDIGTEGMVVRYGEKRMALPEIVDNAEKKGNLLILTSNLSGAEVKQKYGERTFDRLKAITKHVIFTGKSFRK
jgi:DNA replication protein DnaC